MNLNELSKEIHQNAVAHGWWDEPRSFGEIIALCHSELSEALEEYRAGNRIRKGCPTPMIYYSGGGYCATEPTAVCKKPEGIATELADCIIRILDYCGKVGVDVDGELYTIKTAMETGDYILDDDVDLTTFGGFAAYLHFILSVAYGKEKECIRGLIFAIHQIYEWAKRESVDMDEVIRIKHEYNKTRPYRHGGKRL